MAAPNPVATNEFADESVSAAAYIVRLAGQRGFSVEWAGSDNLAH